MVIYLLLLLPLIIIVIFKTRPLSLPLPPGPKPWPIIGNLLHLTKNPHIYLQSLSKLFGPLVTIRLGSQLLIVASSPAAAAEILKTHDRLLSARFVQNALRTDDLDRKALIWASNCRDGTNWKTLRTVFKTRLFSSKAIESQSAVREQKAAEMVDFVGSRVGEEIDVGKVIYATVLNSLFNLIFSRDCVVVGFEETDEAKSLMRKVMDTVAAPNVADFFPIFEKLDPQGLRRAYLSCVKALSCIWKPYVNERRERKRAAAAADGAEDFLDVFLEIGLDDEQIDWLAHELTVAGTDTTSVTTEWAMAELIRNKGAMNKLREELETEFSKGKPLKESGICQLPYLTAIVKETLRLHPPAPLLLPHQAPQTLQVMNYTIPEGARVAINAWAIARDCSIWGEDAESFKPERFMGSEVDFRGQDFELLPFSAGRRMCPGMPSAARQIPLLLANLVWNFDWGLPDGEGLAAEIDMKASYGLSSQKERPLVLVPRSSSILQEFLVRT